MEAMSMEEARRFFRDRKEDYKIELIDDLEADGEKEVTVYRHGGFVDLCKGPHVEHTGEIPAKAFNLDRIAGAYWRGDEKRPMLTRIYGLAFNTKEELDGYINQREEAMKRDSRKLGRELELFTASEVVGKGLPLLLPKGATLRRILERFIVDEELKRGYEHVYTPVLGRKELYEISGHWEHYQESMYPPIEVEGQPYVLRPMTCPHHFEIYRSKLRSYRDLPVRLAEISPMWRKEKSGELYGLIRVMGFHLADAHIFCTPDQLYDEFKGILDLINYGMKVLGLEDVCWYRASLHDDTKGKFVDNPEGWALSEKHLQAILEEQDRKYVLSIGDAAFYGPKLDVQIKTVSGKEETIFTNQIDMVLAERFDLEYTDADGQKKRPLILHRSSIGCLERTIAFLIEHYAGAFPTWLAPIQVRILTISDKQDAYAKKVRDRMLRSKIRVELDNRNESLNKKIREGRLQKIPYLIIIGDKEMEDGTVTARNRDTHKQSTLPADKFIEALVEEEKTYALELKSA
jgi:threonyl-tRNA synthetase